MLSYVEDVRHHAQDVSDKCVILAIISNIMSILELNHTQIISYTILFTKVLALTYMVTIVLVLRTSPYIWSGTRRWK